MIALLLALAAPQASPPRLICTNDQTGERRPAKIVRLEGRERIALQAKLLGPVPPERIASVILPLGQIEWSCLPADGRRYPESLN